ncbi:putative E3 ubiquitin-protein ligase LIN-1 [Lactuca sativa]|uniref:putative E3 ubiquitin-protein ligase LIN-1 n=1 Tax=Lactuca sativa TaxID=4236 RepID=UPI000CD8CE84|nr:putative E3 ubiquitin-protein ligase LIN-1 [Lactuca sativa]
MAGNYRFSMDRDDIARSLITTIGSFIQDRLLDQRQRALQKEQCGERLAAEDESSNKDTAVRYSDQAVLANLDWGMDALEEAINTSNTETKMARLDHAEKMLQVCAMLNSSDKTAGVPNFYLSAWAHLNLSYLWKLRNNVTNAVLHVLEMFSIDPFFSRIDFAPEIWKTLFLPHMSSIVGWYSEERHRIMMNMIPDSGDLSFTADFDQYFNESLVLSMRPDQAEKLQKLEKHYGQSLDENTRNYANYFKDCMNHDPETSKKAIPMMPIAEAPMTPLHEVSRKIPDYVRFGPILPKSAGFSPVLKPNKNSREASSATHIDSENLEDSAAWDIQEGIPEENNESEYEQDEDGIQSIESLPSVEMNNNYKPEPNGHTLKEKNRPFSPQMFSPVISSKTSPKVSSPKQDGNNKVTSTSTLRSNRSMDYKVATSLPTSPLVHHDLSISSADSDNESRDHKKSVRTKVGHGRSSSIANMKTQTSDKSFHGEYDNGSPNFGSPQSSTQSRPPKDFVCPITSHIFSDPVTLETGQTYERKAIEEWMKRGNTTCPITRQPLSANSLPKTNYVLKRLITSWKEQHPDLAQELSYPATPQSSHGSPSLRQMSQIQSRTSNPYDSNNFKPNRFMQATIATSPTSVISQAAVESIISGLKPFITCLCTSEDLKECETAVLTISKMWKESNADSGVHSCLSTSTTVNGFIDVLSASLSREVLRTTVYILSELLVADERLREILTNVDLECLAALLQNGLSEAAVLIYLLKPSFSQLSEFNLVPYLIQNICKKDEESKDSELVMNPKDAAVELVAQVLIEGDENSRNSNALSVISMNAVPSLVMCLERVDTRQSVMYILLCCIHADRSCRNLIATRIDLCYVLELFHAGNEYVRGLCIEFLWELVQLNRRTLCNQILQIIKDEGACSTMHTLLVYLQNAPMEQQPVIASLLLQLDLLVEPRKMSIYREEAIQTLIESLPKKDFPNSQLAALDALSSLSGHLSASGKSLTEAWLLKLAGFDQPYEDSVKKENLKVNENEPIENMDKEEEIAANSWEKRIAFVLCNHEKGLIFNALEECLKSNSIDMTKKCLSIATWLIYMLYNLPDTGVRDAARKALLDQFIYILQSSKNLEEKILSTVALRSFISDPGALVELGGYAKGLYKTLKKLKRSSVVVSDIMKTLMNLPSVNAADMWSCSEGFELDISMNGEVLSLVNIKGRLISSHSDGTIKVWDSGKKALRLIQEVRDHAKAVTCLYVSPSSDKIYSGSLDKTIRVWVIKQEGIHCIQVHDVKETVCGLVADADFAYFFSQSAGVKVYGWSGVIKNLNVKQTVRSLALNGNKLYCGCSGFNIQEVDLRKNTSTTFYAGARKLLGKQSINSLYIQDNLLFVGGTSIDGIAGKVFSLSNRGVIGSLSTGFDIQLLAVNNDFIFGATKSGSIEVWLKERLTKVASIKNSKITSMASDVDGEMLFAGSSDGRIQTWGLD